MKKLFFLLWSLMCSIGMFAQFATDSKGNKIYYGNIAVITRCNIFDLKNGTLQKSSAISEQGKKDMINALDGYIHKYLLGAGLQIVNRDDNVYNDISAILKENMSEDYLDGYQVRAKGQGADYLLLVDKTLVGDQKGSFLDVYDESSIRFINLKTNISTHARFSYSYYEDGNFSQLAKKNEKMCQALLGKLHDWLPRVLVPAKAEKSKVYWVTTKPFGVMLNDQFSIWEFSESKHPVNNTLVTFDELKLLDTKKYSDVSLENGMLMMKTDKVKDLSHTIATVSTKRTALTNEKNFTVTYFSLPFDETSVMGYMKKILNNSVLGAIGETSWMYIETEQLDAVKKEKRLQQSEEFLDGHTVEQMKFQGARYYIKLQNLKLDSSTRDVSFNFNLYDVEGNTLVKSIPIACHITKVQEFVKKVLLESMQGFCYVCQEKGQLYSLYSPFHLVCNEGDLLDLEVNKKVVNPITKEESFMNTKVARFKYEEYRGMRHIISVYKIFDKKAFDAIDWEHDLLKYRQYMDEPSPKAEKSGSHFGKALLKTIKDNTHIY